MKTIIAIGGDLGYSTLLSICNEINIKGVLTDHSSTKVINWAKERNLPLFIGNPRKNEFINKIEKLGDIDLLISVNYLFIFEKKIISLPKIVSMNIHGAKLPLYRGRGPHVRAIINGEKEVGITLHKIDEGCDTGDIILQKVIELPYEITSGEILLQFSAIYPKMILEALSMIHQNSLKFFPQDHKRATYYEKIKPEERKINWESSSIQIYNLVRALTLPYPGAYSYLNKKKIIIWKAEVVSDKVAPEVKNGEIIEIEENSLKVKTKDGVIKIIHYDFIENDKINLSIGDRFMEEYGK